MGCKLGVVIDMTELSILILVYVTLSLIQSHKHTRKKNFCAKCLTKFTVNLDGIWSSFGTCLSYDFHLSFYLVQSVVKGKNAAWLIFEGKKIINITLHSDIYRVISYTLGMKTDVTEV